MRRRLLAGLILMLLVFAVAISASAAGIPGEPGNMSAVTVRTTK